MTQSSAVDLSRLPSPDVVETLSFEEIYADIQADLAALDPELDDLPDSDPAAKLLQVAAYRELILRQRINESARAVMLAHAKGPDLDNIVVREPYNIERLTIDPGDPTAIPPIAPTMESDDALRRRAQLAPARYSTAGPVDAYVFYALGAHADVLDASGTSPSPGVVQVTVLSRVGDGTPSAEVIAAVEAALSEEETRPLTDNVVVQGPELLEYEISATLHLYPGPDETVVLNSAMERIQAYIDKVHRLGLDVSLSGIYRALHTEGVQRVDLLAPAADMVVARHQVSLLTNLTVEIGGRDE